MSDQDPTTPQPDAEPDYAPDAPSDEPTEGANEAPSEGTPSKGAGQPGGEEQERTQDS